jgi:hypothetical protein
MPSRASLALLALLVAALCAHARRASILAARACCIRRSGALPAHAAMRSAADSNAEAVRRLEKDGERRAPASSRKQPLTV